MLFITCIYLAGFLQGSAFVLIPALGNTLAAAPYHFSSSAYALLFLPQTAGAIIGAAAAGWVQRHLGMGRLFRLGLLANLLAMLLLLGAAHGSGQLAYALMLTESLLLGVGFGWTLAAINHYSAYFFSRSASAAITLLNAVIGGATALSPLVLSALQARWNWAVWPLALAIGFAIAWLPRLPEADDETRSVFWPRGLLPFVLVVLVYAICEGSFGSWASVYLSVDKHLGNHAGTLALSAFWGSMTLMRGVLAALPQRWVSRRRLLLISAVGIAACFAALPWLSDRWALVGAFALAGAASSIYYPFVMSSSLARFPRQQTQVAGLVVAALMVGEGLGSYGLGLLQHVQRLDHMYLASALWGVPLLIGAWLVSRPGNT
ncbi:MAG: MFS transporter [Gammaproteobacteria bacterium]|nr:MFS transporter [Gammaproteobacteria bacterium]